MDSEPATVKEAQNQGLNFFGVAVLGLLAASLVHGLQLGMAGWLAWTTWSWVRLCF